MKTRSYVKIAYLHMYKGPKRKQMRIDDYDYSLPGDYFVTICTKGLIDHFGQIANSKIKLSEVGNIADQYWKVIPNHFNNVELDKHVVMPNHVHGIITITDPVGNWHANSLRRNEKISRRFQRLPVIIGSYKSAVTKYTNRSCGNSGFKWQRYYYDHIIETDEALDNIREYITLNPETWEDDFENLKFQKHISRDKYSKLKKNYYNNLFKTKCK
jgi:REP element-mobilizing transposase RayT